MDDEIDDLTFLPPYKIFPLGDSALTIDFGNVISEEINKKVISLFNHLQQHPLNGMIEAIPAYSSLTIFYDVFLVKQKTQGDTTAYEFMRSNAEEFLLYDVFLVKQEIADDTTVYEFMKSTAEEFLLKNIEADTGASNIIRIPVCYDEEFGMDLKWMSGQKNISCDEIIQIHCSKNYRVYMLGFLPGFAYMGEVDEKIAAPRKPQPQKIIAGSIGIAGRQTGIYPMNSPGGWQIIGRTPLKLFDANRSEACLLKAGDEAEFYSIPKDEFENYQSRNS